MEISEQSLQTLTEKLAQKGGSKIELRLWWTMWPIMTQAERKSLLENLAQELAALDRSEKTQ